MSGLEQKLQKKIIDFAEANGAYVTKIITANKNGEPDTHMCYKGRYIAIEIKAPGKIPESLQHYKLACIQKAGGYAFWGDNEYEIKQVLIDIFSKIDLETEFLSRVGYNRGKQ